jgi:hypothetical protein
MDYETAVFDADQKLKKVIPTSCDTDTAALKELIRMGVADFQKITIWRGPDCIYNGRDVNSATSNVRPRSGNGGYNHPSKDA